MTEAFREYLHRPRLLASQARNLEAERLTLWSTCTKMSATFGKIGGFGGSGGDAKDGDKAALADLNATYYACCDELRDAVVEMLTFSDAVAQDTENPNAKRDAAILRLRYARRLGWEAVGHELDRRGFQHQDIRTVYKWHSSALPRIEKFWEENHERIQRKS